MLLLLLSLMIASVRSEKGAVSIILQKSLIIPQGGYSVLNISNDITELNDNVMSGQLVLQIVRKNPYSSMKFDVFYFNQQDQNGSRPYTDVMNCYLLNRDQVDQQYSQYKACNFTKCNQVMWSGFTGNLDSLVNSTLINNKGNVFPSRTFIMENSLFPCQNGTYYPEVQLLETISMTLWPDYLFFDAVKISLLIIIELLVIVGTANYVMYGKLRHLRKNLAKIKEKNTVSDLFTSLEEMKKCGDPVMGIKSKQTSLQLRQIIESRPKGLNPEAREMRNVSEFIMKADSLEF